VGCRVFVRVGGIIHQPWGHLPEDEMSFRSSSLLSTGSRYCELTVLPTGGLNGAAQLTSAFISVNPSSEYPDCSILPSAVDPSPTITAQAPSPGAPCSSSAQSHLPARGCAWATRSLVTTWLHVDHSQPWLLPRTTELARRLLAAEEEMVLPHH